MKLAVEIVFHLLRKRCMDGVVSVDEMGLVCIYSCLKLVKTKFQQ